MAGRSAEVRAADRPGEPARSGDALREELAGLRARVGELERRLCDAATDTVAERQSRRAALNLMEDAIQSHKAQQHEIEERCRVEAALREADRRKDEFLATLAHELRGPLAPVRIGVHFLRQKPAEHAEVQEMLEMIDRQINQFARLVDDLMEVSRITRGRIALRPRRMDLVEVVRAAAETSRPLIEAGRHHLEMRLPAEPMFMDGDAVRLIQVFTNLLSNAAKYTEEGGHIWLELERQGLSAVVRVRDTGAGIPPEMLEKVFDLFTQVDRTYNRSQGGLGIGLTLVRSLVTMHGGSVTARSGGPNKGSEFIVELPLTHHAAALCADEPKACGTSIASHRILVVDDNPDSAKAMGMYLKSLGADVHISHDGPHALVAVRSFAPEAVLMDLGMPEMDGFEVARQIRKIPEGREVTLVAISGWGQEHDRRLAKEAGFSYHLVKPAEPEQVRSLLASVFNGAANPRGG